MKYPMILLPKNVEMALFFINEDLKARKFFNTLNEVGLDDAHYQGHFHRLIADCLDFDLSQDQEFKIFDALLERHAKLYDPTKESYKDVVVEAYVDIMNFKYRQQPKKATIEVDTD